MDNLFMFHVKPVGGSIELELNRFNTDAAKKIECAAASTTKQLQFLKAGVSYYNRITFFGETKSLCPQEMFKNVAKVFSTLTAELLKNTGKCCTVDFYSSPIPIQYIKLEQFGDYLAATKKLTDTQCEITWKNLVNNTTASPSLPGMENTLAHWTAIVGKPVITIRGIKPANMPKEYTIYAVN